MQSSRPRQLTLPFALRPDKTFDTFVEGSGELVRQTLERAARGGGEQFVFLWGGPGTGKTHLLEAGCRAAAQSGAGSVLIPLDHGAHLCPDVLNGLDRLGLVCLDGLQAVAGNAGWEQASFNLYNRCRETGTRLWISGTRGPGGLGLALGDLQSRLCGALVLRLHGPGDEDRERYLRQTGRARGMDLGADEIRYLLSRCRRDIGSLKDALDRLDRASLATHRRVTVALIREVLSGATEAG